MHSTRINERPLSAPLSCPLRELPAPLPLPLLGALLMLLRDVGSAALTERDAERPESAQGEPPLAGAEGGGLRSKELTSSL